jgi:hypothetical protein
VILSHGKKVVFQLRDLSFESLQKKMIFAEECEKNPALPATSGEAESVLHLQTNTANSICMTAGTPMSTTVDGNMVSTTTNMVLVVRGAMDSRTSEDREVEFENAKLEARQKTQLTNPEYEKYRYDAAKNESADVM